MRGVCVACLIGKQKKPILLENGLERLQALALFWVPQDDPLVLPAARENLTVGMLVQPLPHRPPLFLTPTPPPAPPAPPAPPRARPTTPS